jgi:hypothetical protein
MAAGGGFGRRGRLGREALLTLVLAIVASVTATVVGQEWPPLRQGMWEIVRTMQPPGGGAANVVTSRRCITPSDEWKRQHAQLSKAGCTISPIRHSGSTYSFTSTCNVMGISSSTTTTIVMQNDSAYTLTVVGTTDGQPTREEVKAKRIGDCSR